MDERIRLVTDADDGPSDGLNKGLSLSTGDVLGCLNSDDYYRPHIFEEIVRVFVKNPSVDCIYSHGTILKSGKTKFQTSDIFSSTRYFSNRGLVLQQSTFFRNSSLRLFQMNFNVNNKSSWDGEFILELFSKGAKFKRVLGNWGVFRIYPASITGSERFKAQIRQDHFRMLSAYTSTNISSMLARRLLLALPVYSLLRRIRNYCFFAAWKLLHETGFRA
jgi:glycosyltransferase involved in cell wall biosynthesis